MARKLFSAAAAAWSGPTKEHMSHSEAFVETLAAYGVKNVFGVVGSAFMDALDLFPFATPAGSSKQGIRFVQTAHEQGAAHMADGYARASQQHGVCIGQNGPGVSNCVTGIAAAYWAHSPVVMITPECASVSKGLGGFQELDQAGVFEKITKYQALVNAPSRMAELTGRAFDYATAENGPTQLNIPRDFFYGEAEHAIPTPRPLHHPAPAAAAVDAAAEAIRSARNPVIIAGGGVAASAGGPEAAAALAEALSAPVVTSYLHNDSFPASHPLAAGPLGYCGSQAAMKTISEADVVVALGSRLNPFGTTPQYGHDYWPHDATLVQVDVDHRRLSLTKHADVPIAADAGETARALVAALQTGETPASASSAETRLAQLAERKRAWTTLLDTWSQPDAGEERVKPRAALAALRDAMPADAIVTTDVGNTCSVANGYLHFEQPQSFMAAMTFGNCGYAYPVALGAKLAAPERPVVAYVGDGAWSMSLIETMTAVRENLPVTAVVFSNNIWGAENLNQRIWFGDRFVGSELTNPSYAAVAESMGAVGIQVSAASDVAGAFKEALAHQAAGRPTVLEILTTKELGEPFRRDAMRYPKRVLAKYQHTDVSEPSA
ncbi:sulfoacetaldehyde acetyltransferase [Thecamonas trahens ATCC 50062]|uniref:sulfoacetaldehyde acetyltransferase n=1 Tax=Thecamonas trahens ATCC 50062 TaxID=461836 RepID=A0A0L0DVG2_THETB|nr:sulfoacetaldehyde acetyltransferase [Thecamonas trahens ATCC 50062]KNC56210.1 sulfoacetaldehyde acetyltransferase [Thecamonas trahens ATCC 50062]|eukprot:XP_013752668.1 sulfoacetaldehyde acetyltransferase [Thecamonas trahens ATCC 50062]